MVVYNPANPTTIATQTMTQYNVPAADQATAIATMTGAGSTGPGANGNQVVWFGPYQQTGETATYQGPGGTADIYWGGWSLPSYQGVQEPALTGFPGAYSGWTYSERRQPGNAPTERGSTSELVGTYGPVSVQAYDQQGNPMVDANGQPILRTGGQTQQRTPNLKNSNDAIWWLQNGLFNNDPQALGVRQQMIDAGVISPNADMNETLSGWAKFVSYSAGALQHGQFISPFDYLKMWGDMIKQDEGAATTEVTTTRTVYNPADLAAAYQQTSSDLLGRRATPGEASAAAGVVGAEAAKHPQIETATSRTVGGKTTRNVTIQGGYTQAAINEAMMTQAMQSPEYGAYQAAGHYFPALLSAIGAVNQAGA